MLPGNGKRENTVFNSRLQPTQIGLGAGAYSQSLLKLEYSYGTTANNGNVVEQKITVPGVTHPFVQAYTYDELNRLKSATETQNSTQTWKQTFTFDRYGNRNFDEANTTFAGFDKLCSGNTVLCSDLKKRLNPSINTSNNRLSTSDDYAFDASGNTTSDPDARTFIYDAENKQIEVKDSLNATIGEYSYDGDGRRIRKYVPSTAEETIFVYDAMGRLVGEYSTVVQSGSNAKTVYTTNDHLGSPRINTDGVGSVVSRHDYHPFGEEVSRTGYGSDTIRKQFTGYERDEETGLDFAQARMYASNLGRFSVPDPILMTKDRQPDPQRINLYPYTRNNPLKFTDPTGKDIYLENDTPEGRRKALLSATATLKDSEKKNVGMRKNEEGKFELYVKDPSKVDVTKASVGYQFLSSRIDDAKLKVSFTLLEKGKSIKDHSGNTYDHKTLADGDAGVTINHGQGDIQVIVAEGGSTVGVMGKAPSGKEVPIDNSEWLCCTNR